MKKLKKTLLAIAAVSMIFATTLVSCSSDDDDDSVSDTQGTEQGKDNTGGEEKKDEDEPDNTVTPSATPTIYLAGDSTVQTYTDSWFIGGWGQFFQLFLNESNAKVVNCAKGGRSARSFINSGGRLPFHSVRTQRR